VRTPERGTNGNLDLSPRRQRPWPTFGDPRSLRSPLGVPGMTPVDTRSKNGLFRPLTRPVGLARTRHAADPDFIGLG